EETPTFYKFALHGEYPIDTPELIEKASSWFEKNYINLSVDDVFTFAKNVYLEAQNQDINLENSLIEKIATVDPNLFNKDFYYHIKIRKENLPVDQYEAKEIFDELLAKADYLGTIKTAQILELIDEEYNLKQYYSKNIAHPVISTFSFEKNAEGRYIDDIYITKDDIKNIANYNITDLVGTDTIKELRGPDSLDVFSSLPMPIRKKLIELIVKNRNGQS
ncbi:MAG: hypothetical protein N2Z85_03555, partial [Patescibacteria group bacterium]|nr:hypothetical protein [Patescibacteria group bacterium]